MSALISRRRKPTWNQISNLKWTFKDWWRKSSTETNSGLAASKTSTLSSAAVRKAFLGIFYINIIFG